MSAILRVNEIFDSIQGEGVWTGLPCTFVRLHGCNLSCDWCDTKYALKGKAPIEMSPGDMVSELLRREPQVVVWTGGEPLLQIAAIRQVWPAVTGAKSFFVETNGTINPGAPNIFDWVVCSPKPPHYAVAPDFKFHELKVVIDSAGALEVAHELAHRYEQAAISLQPVNNSKHWREIIVQSLPRMVAQDPFGRATRFRLSVQLHKLLDVR